MSSSEDSAVSCTDSEYEMELENDCILQMTH